MVGGIFVKENPNNFMEEVVENLIDSVIKDMDICKCEICRADIIALALNELEPKYFVSEKGRVFTKLNYLNPQFEIDATATITKAAETVDKNRRHE